MLAILQRFLLVTILFALMIIMGGEVFAQVPHKEQRQADALEKLAREEFGQLSAAERTLVRGAASRDVRWVGPNDNPDDPANDPAQTEKWGPDRSIRAGVFAWLVADSEAAPFLHPSGPGIAGAKIVGKLDLSYQNVAPTHADSMRDSGRDRFLERLDRGHRASQRRDRPNHGRLLARQGRPRDALRTLRRAQHFPREYRRRFGLQRRRLHRQRRHRHHLGAGILDRGATRALFRTSPPTGSCISASRGSGARSASITRASWAMAKPASMRSARW